MLKENLKTVEEHVQEACKRAGRSREEVTLIAVSKTKPLEMLQEIYGEGVRDFGENKVQELCDKMEQLPPDIRWHMIGHLQRNKVKQVVGKAALIQSVGSRELLDEIEKVAARMELIQDILLEVNIGGEEAKSGFAPEELAQAAAYAKELAHVRVRGLMTIPPVAVEKGGSIPYFEKVYRLFVDISREMYDNKWEYISMGMSDDYADAVRCGANMVRVGSAIFGARNYNK